MKPNIIWVNIDGGVMGFFPEDIEHCQQEWETIKQACKESTFWDFFNWFFQDDLQGVRAYSFYPSYC